MEYEEVNVTINLTFYLLTMTHLYPSLKLLLMFYIKEMKRGKFRKQKIFRTVLLVRAVCKDKEFCEVGQLHAQLHMQL